MQHENSRCKKRIFFQIKDDCAWRVYIWCELNELIKNKPSHTSQLNSISDSIVQILTLKVLDCFLNSELNPIFNANVLAIAKTYWSNFSTIQSVKSP